MWIGIVLKTVSSLQRPGGSHAEGYVYGFFIPCFKSLAEIATSLPAELENNSQAFGMPFA